MKQTKLFFLIALLTLVFGCGKPLNEATEDEINYLKMKEIEGTYSGTISATHISNMPTKSWLALEEETQLFILQYYPLLNNPPKPPISGNTTLELKDGKFTYNQELLGRGSGNYSIIGDKIIFNVKEGICQDGNFPYLILRLMGEYDYTFDGQNLKIFKETGKGEFYSIILYDIEHINDLEYIIYYECDLKKE